MSNKQQSIDLRVLLHNLKDLDHISGSIGKEIENKNKILVGGLQDCKACRKYIDDNHRTRRAK